MKKKNTLLSLMMVFAIIISSLSVPGDTAFAAKKKIKLNKTKLSLYVKKTYTLKLSGVSAKKKSKIKWSSSNKKIATVNKKGKITAKKNGKCNIYAKYGKKKYKCKLTVKKKKSTKATTKPSVKKTPAPTTKATVKPDDDSDDDDPDNSFPPKVTVTPDTPSTRAPVPTAAPVVNTPVPVTTKKPLFPSSAPDASGTPGESAAPGTASSQPSNPTDKPDTPDATSKPGTTATPVPTPTALPTKKPSATAPTIISTTAQSVTPVVESADDTTLDALAAKVTAKVNTYYGHIRIALTNGSTDWINTLNVSYSFYSSDVKSATADNKDDYEVITDTSVQSDIAPGETRYVTVDSSKLDDPYDIYVAATDITLSVTDEESGSGSYKTVDASLIDVSIGNTDTEHLTFPVTVKNSSENITTVSYIVYLYNDNKQIVDAIADSVSVQASGSITSTYQLPYYTNTSYKNICLATAAQVSPVITASAFVERNYDEELLTYAGNVSVKASTVKYLGHAELTVTNNNSITLSTVTVNSTFYNSANEQIYTDESSLLSIMPGETQYIAVNIDSELLAQIDLSKTQFYVTVQEDNANFSYTEAIDEKKSENYDYSITGVSIDLDKLDEYLDEDGNLTDEPTVDVTIENKSIYNLDVSFKLWFYLGKSKTNYDVYAESVSAPAGETTVVTVPMPYSVVTEDIKEKDEDTGEEIVTGVKTSYVLKDGLKYEISDYKVHRLTDISMNTAKK